MSDILGPLPFWLIVIIFICAASVVWFAGNRLSVVADRFADETGLGSAFIGILVLGGATSLPELITTLTASVHGKPDMAVNNLLGGIAMQACLLAYADVLLKKVPITSRVNSASVVFQGMAGIILLALVVCSILFPMPSVLSIGLGSTLVFIFFLVSVGVSHALQGSRLFIPRQNIKADYERLPQGNVPVYQFIASKHGVILVLLCLVIMVAGYFVVLTAETIGEKAGLSGSLTGFFLVAITTSLPEISTVTSAVQIRKYDLVFANILGTNLFDAALLFPADVAYREGAVLSGLGGFPIAGCALGILITGIFLAGIIQRPETKKFRLSEHSLLALLIYVLGAYMLFQL